jgi:ectoine hydroxylase-related dioxygenase (phytanoyl-CoA dioxygenase family)
MVQVEPPFDLPASMVTVRVHLDAVPESNAPLLVAPGSHKRGRIPTSEIAEVVRHRGIITCLAAAGDIWLYATPILHASDAASQPLHRRVLQIDYAVGQLPGGLEWLGV